MKESILKKLGNALDNHLVDEEVIPLILSINRIPDAVTTSSCSGRIQLIEVPDTGDKLGSHILGKWHEPVDPVDIIGSLKGWDGQGQLHLLVQPLLLHIRCRDLATGVALRNLAHGSGLKFSTIRSLKLDSDGKPKEWGVVVEFLGTERMEVPLHGIDEHLLKDVIPPLIFHGNVLIGRIKKRIYRLIDLVDEEYPYKGELHSTVCK